MQEHGGIIFIDSMMLDAGKIETLGFADTGHLDREVLLLCFGLKSRSGMEHTLIRLGGSGGRIDIDLDKYFTA
ncbi:MAG: hypothetical protein JW913_14130 [Chitinispirillaceae bacterium]|nr:hypothetical protein [Chitinispirillaceae bacterium]